MTTLEFFTKYNGKGIDFDGLFDNGYQLWDNIPMKIMLVNSKAFGQLKVQLDDEPYDQIVQMGKWSASKDRGKFYFHKRISKKDKITLHRFLMGMPQGKYVDHVNGDTLDNRRSNLRICSNAANLRNGSIRTNNKSGITGVRYQADRKKWEAGIKVNYKRISLGRYKTKEEAIEARKQAEARYFND